MRTHAVIPDCQVRAGVPLDYLERIGLYPAEKKPDVIVQIRGLRRYALASVATTLGRRVLKGDGIAEDVKPVT